MSLNEAIIKIRVELQKSKIKKSGQNKRKIKEGNQWKDKIMFEYYELSDFLPKLNELMLSEGVNDVYTIQGDVVKLTLIKGEEEQRYEMPFERFDTPTNTKADGTVVKSMQDIQYLGALNTYYKRYLYLNAFGITDGEVIDGMDNSDLTQQSKQKAPAKKTAPKSTEWRDKVIQGLKVHNVDFAEFAKETGLNTSSTEEQFKKVYMETVANWEVGKQEVTA